MEHRGDSGVVAVVIGLALVLLLLVGGGVGVYYVVSRQQMALAVQADRALLADAQARMEMARAQAEALAKATANVKEPATDPGDSSDSIRNAVESLLSAQEDAWNRGDLDAFMAHYWKSEELTFSSEGNTTRGWTATLTRYRERYPTPEKMGRLKLSGLEITLLGDSAALVLGQWKVERAGGPLSGNFSLVVRKFDDRWLIVHDHTSRLKD